MSQCWLQRKASNTIIIRAPELGENSSGPGLLYTDYIPPTLVMIRHGEVELIKGLSMQCKSGQFKYVTNMTQIQCFNQTCFISAMLKIFNKIVFEFLKQCV